MAAGFRVESADGAGVASETRGAPSFDGKHGGVRQPASLAFRQCADGSSRVQRQIVGLLRDESEIRLIEPFTGLRTKAERLQAALALS